MTCKFVLFSSILICSIFFPPSKGQFFDQIRNVATDYGKQLLSGSGIASLYSTQTNDRNQLTVQRLQPATTSSSRSNSCDSYFSYKTGFYGFGRTSGEIDIPYLDHIMQNEITAVLTVDAKLSVEYFLQPF